MNLTGAFKFTIVTGTGAPVLNGVYFNNDRSNDPAAPFTETAARTIVYAGHWLCGEYSTTWRERAGTETGLLRIRQLTGITNRYELDWFDTGGQWIFTGAGMLEKNNKLWGYYTGVK